MSRVGFELDTYRVNREGFTTKLLLLTGIKFRKVFILVAAKVAS